MAGAFIIGAGPGIGRAVALRFARAGLPVGVIARSQATVDATRAALAGTGARAHALTADATDEAGLRTALDGLTDRLGIPDVLVYNAALIRYDGDEMGELSAADHLESYAVNVVGAITAAAHVLPRMAERGHGTYVITGGLPQPAPDSFSLSLGKAAVRALTDLLRTQFGPLGVHVATVTVAGAVAPGTAFDPDDIAEHYWRLHTEQPGRWRREVLHDGTSRRAG